MKKIFLFCIILFTACNSIPNKSVFEELSTQQLAKAIEKNENFADLYDEISMKGQFLQNMKPSKKVQYKDITWRSLYNYYSYGLSLYNFETDSILDLEYNEMYSNEIHQADSTIKYWQDYVNNYCTYFDTIVQAKVVNDKIEWEDDYDFSSYVPGVDWSWDPKFKIKRKKTTYYIKFDLQNNIDSLDYVTYIVKEKGKKIDKYMDGTAYNITRKYNIGKFVYYNKSLDIDKIIIKEIKQDGYILNHTFIDYSIPFYVEKFIYKGYGYEDVLRDIIGYSKFISRDDYKESIRDELLQNKDILIYEFIKEINLY